MADLPTNTSYGGDRNPNTAYAAAKKAIMERFTSSAGQAPAPHQPAGWQPSKTKVNWGPGQQPVANIPYAMPTVDQAHPQVAAPQQWTNNQTGEVVTSYVPPNYQTVPGEQGKYSSPSDVKNLRFRNVPENLEGGQYVVDTEQPGAMIRSQRSVRPDQYEGSKMEYPSETVGGLSKEILGGFKPASDRSHGLGFQIDHIVPLWLGGADTPENKQLLDPFTHEKKTKIQAVALTLLQAGKITTDQAKMMAIPWREKDDSAITTFNNGFVDLKEAENVAKKWQEDASKPAPVKWSNVWDELKNLKNFGQEKFGTSAPAGFFREFVKSGASSATFGYIPYEMDDDYKDGVAKAAALAGSVAGNVVGFLGPLKLIGGAFGLMNKGLKTIGMLSKVAEGTGVGANLMEKIGLSKNVGKATGLLLNEAPKLENTAKWVSAFKNAGLFATYGQLSKEGLLGQALTGEQNHWGERFLWDVASGGSMGKWSNPSQAAKEALKVASLSTTLDAMLRADDPDWTVQSSIANGLTMGGLHYIGLKSGGGLDSNMLRRDIVSGQMDPRIKTGLFSAAKNNPKIKAELQKTTGLNSAALEAEIEKAQAEMAKKIVSKEGGNNEDFDTATKQYILNLWNARQMYIKGLPEGEQYKARLEDMSSILSHVYKNEPIKDRITLSIQKTGQRLNPTAPKAGQLQYDASSLPEGTIRIPMAGTEANPTIKRNIETAQQLNKEGRLGGEGVMVRRPEQGALINAATDGRYTNPENLMEVYVPVYADKTKTTLQDWLHIGNVPSAEKVDMFNKQNQKFTPFDVEAANKDTIGGQMSQNGEFLRRFDLEWFDPETAGKKTAAAVIQLKPDASERSKIFNDAYVARQSERAINESVSGITESKLGESGMPVEWMNGIVAEFKHALSSGDGVAVADAVNKTWGKNTLTPEGAQAILDNPTFTIGDMFKLVKNSPKWKKASYVLDEQIRPSNEAATAFKEYQNTNIKAKQPVPDVKSELPSITTNVKKARTSKKKINANEVDETNFSENQTDYVFPSKAVTLGGADTGEIAPKRFKGVAKQVKEAKPKVATKKVPKGVSEAIRGAAKAVRESPLAKQSKVSLGAPEMPQIMQKERTRPLGRISQTDASTGQNTPVSRTPQAVSAKTAEPQKQNDMAQMANDMEVLFEDAVESKIASLQEKNITDPDQIAKSVSGVLRNMRLPVPAGTDPAAYVSLQRDIKNTVATKYGVKSTISEETPVNTFWSKDRTRNDEVGADYVLKTNPTKQQKKLDRRIAATNEAENRALTPKQKNEKETAQAEAIKAEKKTINAKIAQESGKQTLGMFRKLASEADKKIASGEKLGTWDGLAVYLREIIPKIYKNDQYAESYLGWNFVKNMMRDQVDSVGAPKSQSGDLINFMIAHERKTGLPPKPSDYKKVLEAVKKERDSEAKLGDANEEIAGMKIKGVRQKDEAYDWMTEAEFNMPEIAANFRKGTDNFIDGLSAGNKLARQMIKNQVSFFERMGFEGTKKYPDLNSIQKELMKKYNVKPLETTKAVKEDVEAQKEKADAALTQKIREWNNQNRAQEVSFGDIDETRIISMSPKQKQMLSNFLDAHKSLRKKNKDSVFLSAENQDRQPTTEEFRALYESNDKKRLEEHRKLLKELLEREKARANK